MKIYDSYKNTDVQWIGKIPSHWSFGKMKYQLSNNDGGAWGDDLKNENTGTIVIRSTEITIDGKWNLSNPMKRLLSDTELKKTLLCSGDIIITKSSGSPDHIGKSVIVNSEVEKLRCSFSNFVQRIRFKNFNPKLYHYILNNYITREQYRFLTQSSIGLGNLNSTTLNEIILPLIPISEQQKILSFLDNKTSLIDSLIEKIQKKNNLLKEKRLKLVEDILLNSEVKRIQLKHLVDLVKRPIHRDNDNSYTKIGMYNWARGIFKHPSKKGSDLGDSTFNYIKEGDFLLSGQFSWEGSVSIVEKEFNDCIASHRFHILNVKKNLILNEYLWSYFTSQEGHFLLKENSPGSAGRNRPLNIMNLLKEKLPYPKMSLQLEIQRLVIETNEFEKYSKQKIKLLKEYRQSLISSVVTGKVRIMEDMV